MNSCQSPMHAWYLKYDYYSLNDPTDLLINIEEVIKSLNTTINYTNSSQIKESPPETSYFAFLSFSNNNFDRFLQLFLMKILDNFLSFLKNEIICLDSEDSDLQFLEKAFNFLNLEVYYCQTFWKASPNKPFPDFFRDRLMCSLFRVETLLLSLHECTSLQKNPVFSQILKFLGQFLKESLLELQALRDFYRDFFDYLLRFFELLLLFPLSETTKELEAALSQRVSEEKVGSLKKFLLEKSRNKGSFKQTTGSYRTLYENSLTEQKTRKSTADDIDEEFSLKRFSSKTHSNSFENTPSMPEQFEALDRLSKRTSKTVSAISKAAEKPVKNEKNSPKLLKTLTFKSESDENEELFPFLSKFADSYLTTQLMNSQNYCGIYANMQRNLESSPQNSQELSVIQSTSLLKSPNFPANSFLSTTLRETSLEETLGAKLVAGVKSRQKMAKSPEKTQEIDHNNNSANFLNISASLRPQLLKKPSEIAEKLSQNLFTALVSRDSAQIRDNILIAKNKKRTQSPRNTEQASLDIDGFFEKRRKDRLIHSNRESSVKDEDFMNRSLRKLAEAGEKSEKLVEKAEKMSLQSNDERKPKEKITKTIEFLNIKERDFIKISKATEIKEKLTAAQFREHFSNEPLDEEIMEISEEDDETQGENASYKQKEPFFEFFRGILDAKVEETCILPGKRVKITRKNIMPLFQPLYNLSARRKGMYENISRSLVSTREELLGEFREVLCFFKGDAGFLKRFSVKEAFFCGNFNEIQE